MIKYQVREVFTPTSVARLTFVERNDINEQLVDALITPGKQLVVYGDSGSGKTTLLINKLHQIYEHHITTHCMAGMNFDQILLECFSRLNPFYTDEIVERGRTGITGSLRADYLGIMGRIESTSSREAERRDKSLLPPQLTAQTLGIFLGKANCCWVLEDFHKIPEKEKTKLSNVMKIFMDMADEYQDLKIIAIGAVGTAREVVAFDLEMKNRVAEINVPLMTNQELLEILKKGENLLNIFVNHDIKLNIVNYSSGLASVCHQLGLNLCVAAGIYETLEIKKIIDKPLIEEVLSNYVKQESDTMKATFDKALKLKKKTKYDTCKLILESLALTNTDDGLTRTEILRFIKEKIPYYTSKKLTSYLKELQCEDRGVIIRHDPVSGKYSYSNPFQKVFARVLFLKKRSIEFSGLDHKIEQFLINTVEILEKFGPDAVISFLVKGLQNEDYCVCVSVAKILGDLGPDAVAAVPALIKTLREKDERVSAAAAEALKRIRSCAIPFLSRALLDDDCDWKARLNVVWVLSDIGPDAKAAVPALIKALEDDDESVRTAAARALGNIGPAAKEAVPSLILALRDDEWSIREDTAEALGKIGPAAKEAVPYLQKALHDPEEEVRASATKALTLIED